MQNSSADNVRTSSTIGIAFPATYNDVIDAAISVVKWIYEQQLPTHSRELVPHTGGLETNHRITDEILTKCQHRFVCGCQVGTPRKV